MRESTIKERQEIKEQMVFDKFSEVSDAKITNPHRGKRNDFVCEIEGRQIGIELQSYQHDAEVRKIDNFKDTIVRTAQDLYEARNHRMLLVSLHFVHGFPGDEKKPQREIDEIVSKLVSFVELYSSRGNPRSGNEMSLSLYHAKLDSVFYAISIRDFPQATENTGSWIAQRDAYWGTEITITGNCTELIRRIQEKDKKHSGYLLEDPLSACWLLMYHEGVTGADLSMNPADVSTECRQALDVASNLSPFQQIILFDPFWSKRLYIVK